MNKTDAHTVHKTQLTLTSMLSGTAHHSGKLHVNYLTYWSATSLWPPINITVTQLYFQCALHSPNYHQEALFKLDMKT